MKRFGLIIAFLAVVVVAACSDKSGGDREAGKKTEFGIVAGTEKIVWGEIVPVGFDPSAVKEPSVYDDVDKKEEAKGSKTLKASSGHLLYAANAVAAANTGMDPYYDEPEGPSDDPIYKDYEAALFVADAGGKNPKRISPKGFSAVLLNNSASPAGEVWFWIKPGIFTYNVNDGKLRFVLSSEQLLKTSFSDYSPGEGLYWLGGLLTASNDRKIFIGTSEWDRKDGRAGSVHFAPKDDGYVVLINFNAARMIDGKKENIYSWLRFDPSSPDSLSRILTFDKSSTFFLNGLVANFFGKWIYDPISEKFTVFGGGGILLNIYGGIQQLGEKVQALQAQRMNKFATSGKLKSEEPTEKAYENGFLVGYYPEKKCMLYAKPVWKDAEDGRSVACAESIYYGYGLSLSTYGCPELKKINLVCRKGIDVKGSEVTTEKDLFDAMEGYEPEEDTLAKIELEEKSEYILDPYLGSHGEYLTFKISGRDGDIAELFLLDLKKGDKWVIGHAPSYGSGGFPNIHISENFISYFDYYGPANSSALTMYDIKNKKGYHLSPYRKDISIRPIICGPDGEVCFGVSADRKEAFAFAYTGAGVSFFMRDISNTSGDSAQGEGVLTDDTTPLGPKWKKISPDLYSESDGLIAYIGGVAYWKIGGRLYVSNPAAPNAELHLLSAQGPDAPAKEHFAGVVYPGSEKPEGDFRVIDDPDKTAELLACGVKDGTYCKNADESCIKKKCKKP